ncbi:adenosylcobinamide-phosphate synthase CbiB [Conexibacter sp. SYSU D00693]|uniref:adenosylcobinamide-phosphate synthase CbiB n=1 Tax=Conexibacter sp. SYSU D00693 TaxID=2812560 RepID=UPI00196AB49A|nr:adenosylcobinamide-phosphate synthase CbiB [Conexibacter sp. SYSU D00693]
MPRSAGLVLAVALDAAAGDPARLHPVAGFGQLAARAERALHRPSKPAGALYAAALVLPPTLMARRLERRGGRARTVVLTAAAAWTALGGTTLRRIAARMADLVEAGDLDGARELARSLVARRTDALDGPELVRAALESLAENTADAIGGPLVWTALAGPAGAVAHRAADTLDSMVGYKDARHAEFGWASARLDDLLNLPVSRATAAATVVAAALTGEDAGRAVRVWRRDGGRHPSPNAGQAEAAFAGALRVTLGGTNVYGEVVEERPRIGDGPRPDVDALRRAVRLSAGTQLVLAAACVAGAARWR